MKSGYRMTGKPKPMADLSDEFDDLLDELVEQVYGEGGDESAICLLADELSRRYHSLERGYENLIG